MDGATADLAADLRRQFKWKLPDAMQATVTRRHGLKLATGNAKDFPLGRYSFVVVPY